MTATTASLPTVPSTATTLGAAVEEPGALRCRPVITQTSYVFPPGRGETVDDHTARPSGATTSCPSPFARDTGAHWIRDDREAGLLGRQPVVRVAEPAVERDGPGAERDRDDRGDGRDRLRPVPVANATRRRNGTTFCGSARAAARIRSRSAALRRRACGRQRERARHLPEGRQLLTAARRSREVLLEGLALLGVEGVQCVARVSS